MTFVLSLAGPLLALGGVVIGLWVGERRWRVEQARQREVDAIRQREEYIHDERRAYTGLWDVAARTQEEMRGALDSLTAERFSGMLADVNAYMLQEGLYIDRDDRLLTIEYLFWVNEYFRLVATTHRGDVLTSMIHEGLPHNVALVDEVLSRANELRSSLRARIREKLGAPESMAWDDSKKPSEALMEKLRSLNAQVANERAGSSVPLETSPQLGGSTPCGNWDDPDFT